MSRCIQRRNNRITRSLNQERWLADCRRAEAREARRAQIANRIKELSDLVRTGDAEAVAELDSLMVHLARVAP